MVLKSYAKINLTLSINNKLKSGLHNIQSIYCLIDLHDKMFLKKIKNKNFDQVSFAGPFSKDINKTNNSVKKVLKVMRKNKIIYDYYSVKVNKKIPVFAGLGGGTGNAATLFNHFAKKKFNKKIFDEITKEVGSDFRLFSYNLGFQKDLKSVVKIDKKHRFYFLLIFPKIKSSTKSVYLRLKKYSKLKIFKKSNFHSKKDFINYLKNSKNDLQLVVEKKHPIIKSLLKNISSVKGCHLSRMTGSGSSCYGVFKNEKNAKIALKKLKKKFPNFLFFTAKSI